MLGDCCHQEFQVISMLSLFSQIFRILSLAGAHRNVITFNGRYFALHITNSQVGLLAGGWHS